MDKYFMWIHYERLHNHNKAKHNKTVCIFLGIYCIQIDVQCDFRGNSYIELYDEAMMQYSIMESSIEITATLSASEINQIHGMKCW